MNEPLITFAEAAKIVGPDVTARTLRTWHEKGILIAIRVGRQWRTTRTDVETAVALLWQSSFSTARQRRSGQSRSPECAASSGTSRGMKDEAAKSAARAEVLVKELTGQKEQRHASKRKECSEDSSPLAELYDPWGHLSRQK